MNETPIKQNCSRKKLWAAAGCCILTLTIIAVITGVSLSAQNKTQPRPGLYFKGSASVLEIYSISTVVSSSKQSAASKHPYLLGLYTLVDGNVNNRPVYKRIGGANDKTVYLNVEEQSSQTFWRLSPSMDDERTYLLTNTRTAPAKPPSTGWMYHDGNGWTEDLDIMVTPPTECCDELEIFADARNGAKDFQQSLLGKFRLSETQYNGRFVYQQVNGGNMLYYRNGKDDPEGWYVGTSYFQAGMRAGKSRACPLEATGWRYRRRGSQSWTSDYSLKINCSVRDFVCATTDSTEKGASPNTACRFPFLYRGKVFETCTDVGDSDGQWCLTSTKTENGVYIGESMWGYCSQNCPVEGSLLLSRSGITWIAIVVPILVVLIVIIIIIICCVVKRRRNAKMMKLLDSKSTYSPREESSSMRERSREGDGGSSRRDSQL